MFKKRNFKFNIQKRKMTVGNVGLYTIQRVRYELVYLRILKKCIRQKFIRRKVNFLKCKFWFFLKPNYILTAKSTNARMGAGTGSLVRVAVNLDNHKTFVCLSGYSAMWALRVYRKLKYRYSFYFLIKFK